MDAFYLRIKHKLHKKWVKINNSEILTKEIIDDRVKQAFRIDPTSQLEYFDEARFQIPNELLVDFLWTSTRGVILEVKEETADFEELFTLSPRSAISQASTVTISSGISEVPSSIICANSLSPKPEKGIILYSFDEEKFQQSFKTSVEGTRILTEYKETGEISIANRKKINLVVSLMTDTYGSHPSKDIKLQYAKAVVNLFPCFEDNEGKGYELFFCPERRIGFLENRLRTLNRGSSSKIFKKTITAEVNQEDLDENHEDIDFLKNACVKTHKKEIFQAMLSTFNARKNCENILEEYPRFIDTPGLITQDFHLMHQNHGNLATKIPELKEAILSLFKLEVSKDLPSEWNDEINTLICLLHLLPPTARGRSGGKKVSINAAIDKLILFHQLSIPLESALTIRKTNQPYLLAVGPCKNITADYYIILDNNFIRCESKNALGAIDELFQCHFVFKIKYEVCLKSFWSYIQAEIYAIKTNDYITLTPREREIKIKLARARDKLN